MSNLPSLDVGDEEFSAKSSGVEGMAPSSNVTGATAAAARGPTGLREFAASAGSSAASPFTA